jgi:hypothetical protein
LARNGSGTYSLVAGNPVVTGTTISSTWANNTLNDIATALTASVANDGQTPILASQNFGGFDITNLGSVTLAGTLTAKSFVGTSTGGRFTADFSNGTFANRLLFKTSTNNSSTNLGAIPNGSSTTSFYQAFAGSDPDNAGYVLFGTDGTNNYINTLKNGSGTVLGFNIYTNNLLALSVSTSQICAFSNSPTMPTAAPGTNNTQGATTAFCAAIDALTMHKAGVETVTGVKTFSAAAEPVSKNITKIWCMFNGTTAGTNAPTAGFNVTSVTRNGVGDYTVNFAITLSTANYGVFGTVGYSINPGVWCVIARNVTATPLTTTSVRIITTVSGGVVDAEIICVEILCAN